ncbi:MAG: DUF1549 domain-containing protein, partial [Planctomycetales bacterium]|nr:DUF1549 domain-containing protein [Planctomycetales bacterium]
AIVGGADPTLGELAAAVELYAGDFLDDLVLYDCEEWSAWARDRREDYRRQALGALQRLAQAHLDQGNAGVAERYARRQIELDHLDERAYQQLFLALARGGQRTTALGEYEALRRLLKNELSAPPSQVTDEIIAQIRTGALDGDTITAKTAVDDREKSAAAAEAEIALSAGPVPSSASGASNPYRGLFTFREEDAADFFGREEFIDQLITAVYQRPLAAVVGPSGSGKSSVIHAGLIPVLRQEHGWIIATFRPGRRPYHALAGALMPLFEAEQSETDRLLAVGRLADGLEQVPLPLMEVLERIRERQNGDPPQGSPARFLLVIDQFEELYTLGAEAAFRERFLDTLLKAVFDQQHRPSPSFTLVFALRADFLGQMLAYRPLADALTDGDAKLGPMRRAEMTRAIVNPAHLRGVAFEPGLVARILDDVHEEPGGLPLLQFALDMLWMEQEENQLSHRAYERIGRVHGALARHAETVYADLNERDQPLARRIFVQVVRPGLSTEDTRRLATRSEIGDEAWSLVQRLADSRLLVTNRDDAGQETVEVVHEALIRGWQRLQDWLRTDREFRLWQERLRGAMAQWGASQYDNGALLRGRPLSEAEGWLVDREADLSTTESEYIQASIDYRDERRAEAARIQEEQRQRELAAARSLTIEAEARRVAEAQHAAEAEARASEQAAAATQLRRRARWLAFASLVTLIRRLSLDLTGVPPTIAEVDEFVGDERPDAYSRLVDRLLASPRYGERWGRHWLDAARYADSNGFTRDFAREIWKYRDWVIAAINSNMPFDQFTIEQIAGDMLPDATLEQRIATGFHRNTLFNEEGGTDDEQFRVDAVADRVATTGAVFLGLTLECARCHSHKYDPISQREFYQMFALLNNCDEPKIDAPYDWQIESGELARRDEIRERIARLEKDGAMQRAKLDEVQVEWEKTVTPELRNTLPGPVQSALMVPIAERNETQRKLVYEVFAETEIARQTFNSIAEINRLRKSEPAIPTTMVLRERSEPRETFVHLRGNFLDHGPRVSPGVPEALGPLDEAIESPTRLDFARWLVDPQNPLTPRVVMNRSWQRFFGRGIV